jgi:hypothetical protein
MITRLVPLRETQSEPVISVCIPATTGENSRPVSFGKRPRVGELTEPPVALRRNDAEVLFHSGGSNPIERADAPIAHA